MESNIRSYVDEIFYETKPTRKAVELKEEMIQNLQEKYRDLVMEGKAPEAAYNIVIAGIGDVSSLLGELDSDSVPDRAAQEEARRRSGMFIAIAVTMYILAVLPVLILQDVTGIVILIAMAAVATGLLVYNSIVRPSPDDDDDDDSMVSNFRAWQAGTHERRTMMKAISSAFWSVVVALYIIVSFITGAWHLTWVIFLFAGALQSLFTAFMARKN